MTVILGIDPGSRCTGFGVIEASGANPSYIASGVVRPPTAVLAERLGHIFRGVSELIARYHPDAVAIEDIFFARDPRAALRLGQARGAAVVALVQGGLPVAEYSARTVKQAVVGKGSATKEQVQAMVRQLLCLPAAPPADAADALAVAICHMHASAAQSRIGAGRYARGRWQT